MSDSVSGSVISTGSVSVLPKDFIASELINFNSKETLRMVPEKDLFLHLNPRNELGTYEKDQKDNLILIESFRTEGWHPGSRVLALQNSLELNGNTRLQVLQGHRRVTCARYAGLTVIPCIIISGLTEAQKYDLIVQPKSVEYGAIGEYKA